MPDNTVQVLDRQRLSAFVRPFINQRAVFLNLAKDKGSPLYVFDREVLVRRAEEYRAAFQNRLPRVKTYYAVKSNNYPEIARSLVDIGFGLDVSSGEELRLALALKARDIIFSGPGKTDAELDLAIAHAARITILIDSFGELNRLGAAALRAKSRIRAGVRLTTDERGLWRKFGIPLSDLERFMAEARSHEYIDLAGVQFHSSWNLNPGSQAAFIVRLAKKIKTLDPSDRDRLRFVDIGGGYWPPHGEWLHGRSLTEEERRSLDVTGDEADVSHYCRPATGINDFARALAGVIHDHLLPLVPATILVEPGRWICNDAMHILLTVVDKKADDLVITDGGTNIVGWERYETDYFPVINLSRPSETEHRCLVLGALCTPHDVWGYAYFGTGIEPGDVLMIPTQGAYTYSLRQHFIKSLPPVVSMPIGRETVSPAKP